MTMEPDDAHDADDSDEAPPQATDAQIATFEQRIGARLPADYRQYLLTVNGGSPMTMYRGEVVELFVQRIFSLLDDEERGLIWERKIAYLAETFKQVLLPVASVNGGDLLYLSLVNGEVFLYTHEDDSYSRIEKSFSGVLEKMDPADD